MSSSNNNQEVIDPVVSKRYFERMAIIEGKGHEAADAIVEYWWNIWCIYRDGDYKALGGRGSLEEWIGVLSQTKYGPSRQTFFNKMMAVKRWVTLGKMREEGVRHMLSSNSVATERDVAALWIDPVTQKLKPDVEKNIKDGRETIAEAFHRIADLPVKEQRKETARLAGEVLGVYFSEPVYNSVKGTMTFNATIMDDGIPVEEFTVTARSLRVKPKPSEKPEMPGEVAQALSARLGLRL